MPSSVTPCEVAMALTVIEGNLYEKIPHWDYVNYLVQYPENSRLYQFDTVHYSIKIWVLRSVLE